jgi:hypothetical protein
MMVMSANLGVVIMAALPRQSFFFNSLPMACAYETKMS